MWNRIEQFLKRNCLGLLEKWLDRGVIRPDMINYSSIKNILVVRQHDYLGDFLLATPVFRALRHTFPTAHIGALVRSYTEEVARYNEYLDEVIVFLEHGRLWSPVKIWRFIRQLRRGWDLAIVLNTVSHSLTSDLLARLSGARYILGSEHRVFPGCQRNFFYNLVAAYLPGERHQTDRNLDIVRHLGATTADKKEVLTLRPQDTRFAVSLLRRNNITGDDRIIAIHIGAGKAVNRWPTEKFAGLANLLFREFQVRILVAWGPNERELGQDFLPRLSFQPVVLQGLSLRQLSAVLSLVDGFVCNDTGVMHLAAAAGAPLVAIFGPTDPKQWKPLGDRFVALRSKDERCASVSVQQVLDAVLALVSPALPSRSEPPEEGMSAVEPASPIATASGVREPR